MRALALVLAVLVSGAVRAQDATDPGDGLSLGQLQSAVLTLDTEGLFNASLFGQRITANVRTQTDDLAAQNRQIEAALTAEEQSLTDRRPSMSVEAFRAEAEAFDAKVQGIRQAQDAKERALQTALSSGRDAFLTAVSPVLAQMMRDSGAVVILDRRSVVLAAGTADITDEAIAAIDQVIGDGAAIWPPAEAPQPAPGAGTAPGADPGTAPGTDPDPAPGAEPGADPGTAPGTTPDPVPGADSSTGPGTDPGTDPVAPGP